jgi:alanyl-tRNA synthetase
MQMRSKEIRKKFIEFFKKQGHIEIPGTSLISDDPTLLLVNAGMVQFKSYFLGEEKPPSKRITNCQKCFRTVDIDKVGDNSRTLTFFEMLGNWSIGDYNKKEAIAYAWDLLTKDYKLNKNKLWVSIFKGDKNIPFDKESLENWLWQGVKRERIVKLGIEDNFWIGGPSGPCGPCTEIYYDLGEDIGCGKRKCQPGCDCDRFLEIWNLVFIEYYKDENGEITRLPIKSVDTGAGLERLAVVLQEKKSVFETDLFGPIINLINQQLTINNQQFSNQKAIRIIADHIKGAVFLITDGVLPSNIERGYILRRILRRAIRYGKLLELPKNFLIPLAQKVIEIYQDVYPEIKSKENDTLIVIQNEEEKFEKTLEKGLKEFEKLIQLTINRKQLIISGKEAFGLFQSYGLPIELIEELAKERGFKVDKLGFYQAQKEHQEISRAGAEKKFGGIGKEITYQAKKLHTATHLLHQALREVLGKQVKQMGSDINPQRLRFDFSHPQKMTESEIKKVEDLVNQKIKEDLEVKREQMNLQQALNSGALSFFKEKYPEKVTVYSIGNFSKEICAGPHVERTSELGHFRIIKEESSGAGIRRIRAILE